MDWETLFCDVDDYCQVVEPQLRQRLLVRGERRRDRDRRLTSSEMRKLFDQYEIGWSYWSFNEDYSVMTSDRTPSGPANQQTPDKAILHALLPDTHAHE
jgi:hypothetical protein